MLKNVLKTIAIFIIGMVGGIFADQIFWPYFVERPLFYQYGLEQRPIYVTERKEIYIQENQALRKAIEKVEKTIIGIKTQTKNGKILEGSGFIVTSDGLIITLAELVPQGGTFNFFVEGTPHQFSEKIGEGEILKRDLKENLALIKIKEDKLATTAFADLEKIKLGERVFLVGVVFEKEIPQKIVNEGIIRSFSENLIKTNISEKENLKGSPLFNIKGEVLGLNIINSQGKVETIPISKIKKFLQF